MKTFFEEIKIKLVTVKFVHESRFVSIKQFSQMSYNVDTFWNYCSILLWNGILLYAIWLLNLIEWTTEALKQILM